MTLRLVAAAGTAILMSGCALNDDPAEGGFLSGVAGTASGSYQERVDALEGEVAAGEARQAELEAELARLNAQMSGLKSEITRQRSQLAAAGTPVPPELEEVILMTLSVEPEAQATEDRLAALRREISQARSISEQLSGLSSS